MSSTVRRPSPTSQYDRSTPLTLKTCSAVMRVCTAFELDFIAHSFVFEWHLLKCHFVVVRNVPIREVGDARERPGARGAACCAPTGARLCGGCGRALHERTDLDGAGAHGGDSRGDGYRCVEILGLEEVVAAEL